MNPRVRRPAPPHPPPPPRRLALPRHWKLQQQVNLPQAALPLLKIRAQLLVLLLLLLLVLPLVPALGGAGEAAVAGQLQPLASGEVPLRRAACV